MSSLIRKLLPCAAFALVLGPAACDRPGETPLSPDPGLSAPSAPSEIILPDPYVISCAGSPNGGGRFGCSAGSAAIMYISGVWYDASAEQLHFTARVFNSSPQPLGTTDGTTPHPEGVRVFFPSNPWVLIGEGEVSAADSSDVAMFDGSWRPFYQYDGVIPRHGSSTRHWTLNVPATVDSFHVDLGVAAAVPKPNGWINVHGTPSIHMGGTRGLTGYKADALGNPIGDGGPIRWRSSDTTVATVDLNSGIVTGTGPGTATITASDSLRSGSVTFIVYCSTLGVGGVTMTANISGFCYTGGFESAEFIVVPLNVSPTASTALTYRATGIIPVSGSANLVPGGGGSAAGIAGSKPSLLRAADAWEERLRRREEAELSRRISLTRAAFREKDAGARRAVAPGVPSVGSWLSINAEAGSQCAAANLRAGRVAVVGTRSIVVVDTMNPAGGLTTADYQEIASRFDTLVWPTLTANFGVPSDLDLNDRVILFFTRKVNELTPAGSPPVSAGFALRRDLFPTSACATSNESEIIYLAAADPSGTVNGNARTAASVKDAAARTIGHELEHVINASRRLYVSFAPAFEETWLDEGLAQIGEELLFYAASGLTPRANLGYAEINATTARRAAFTAYAERNHARFREWLMAPHASGFFQGDDDLATRGAAWAFLRYAADRKGGAESATWSALVGSNATGMANLHAVLGIMPYTAPLNDWLRDFTAASYIDDAGTLAVTQFRHLSWNFRALFAALDYTGDNVADGFPLAPRDPASGATDAFTLASGGGAAYLRFSTPIDGNGIVNIRQAGGGTPPSNILLAVIRRK